MTYEPIPETVVSTPFGEDLRLIFNSENFAQILAISPDEGKITVNGVTYSGRIEFERHDQKGWRVKRGQTTYTEYVSGLSLKRVDDWSKGLSDSAKAKLLSYFDGAFCDHLAASSNLASLTRKAQLRNARAAVIRLNSEYEEACRQVADTRQALNNAEAELRKLL